MTGTSPGMKLQVAFNTLVSKQSTDDFALALALPPSSIPSPTATQDTYICTSDLGVYQVHFPILACASPILCFDRRKEVWLALSAKILRGLLSDPGSWVYVENDPWSAFLVAQQWGFINEMNTASRKLVGQVDLTDDGTLESLQASESGIKVLAWLVARQTKLATRLLSSPLSDPSTPLVCFSCPDTVFNWINAWAQNLYKALSASAETPELFGLASVLEVAECEECREIIVKNAKAVETWMRSVRDDLKSDVVLYCSRDLLIPSRSFVFVHSFILSPVVSFLFFYYFFVHFAP
ncbi:hypothetical protein RHS01_08473 [Rhizoctonia solani]|uniref:Uncharacterized protein n=1 Tax=Rhizoctonia solani TaxID=456999 RepID=A0A8H7I5F2_9AGAM|nr:hypothetical protein RHS01_08473 [Rhizoctonia solani]